jgi:hypothetical protein
MFSVCVALLTREPGHGKKARRAFLKPKHQIERWRMCVCIYERNALAGQSKCDSKV